MQKLHSYFVFNLGKISSRIKTRLVLAASAIITKPSGVALVVRACASDAHYSEVHENVFNLACIFIVRVN